MKRGTRPFIVEVRRGQKKAAIVGGEEETGFLRNDAVRRAEAALFGTPAAEHDATKPVPASTPAPRRILASLTEPEPAPVFVDAEPRENKAEKAQKSAQPRQDRRRRSQDSAGRSVPLTPELVSAALDQIEKVTHAEPRATGSQTIAAPAGGSDTPSSIRRKTNGLRRVAPAQKQGQTEAASVRAHAGAPAKKAAPVVMRNAASDAAPRRPSIRGRYVFGTEPKPGEKWKRRLRGGR
ncbi:MAG TPA: hypothetical protein VG271_15590 [Beijerinckiaceae bacterium]|jgi:hypothetical protein|nr:hypothetical protein [Beijerinckiaceae bacterium]